MPTVYSLFGSVEVTEILSNTGGQSDVYRFGDNEVVKLLLDPTEVELQKLSRLMSLGAYKAVEDIATIPTELLYSSWNPIRFNRAIDLVGYRMRLAKDYVPLDAILDIESQKQLKLSLRDIVEIFIELHHVLRKVHDARFVVGDLHAHNVMINLRAPKGQRVILIDADGWGYLSEDEKEFFPVLALAAEIEHPRLQPSASTNMAQHQCQFERDWFAFALYLAHALTGMPPYSTGSVPRVTNEQERKKRGLTIMSRQVLLDPQLLPVYQRMGMCTEDVLNNWLTVSARGEFPLEVLTEYLLPHIVQCPKCHFKTRLSYWCPRCRTVL